MRSPKGSEFVSMAQLFFGIKALMLIIVHNATRRPDLNVVRNGILSG